MFFVILEDGTKCFLNKGEIMDTKFDNKLLIRTTGIREWREDTPYNRCESTPYLALERLFEKYKINADDQLVDFGAGRGRVAFYIHNKFNIPITAVELNELTLDEALRNKKGYRTHASHLQAPIHFQYGYAEQYEIQKDDNKFYFFNPFKANIFEKVVQNIVQATKESEREIDIILYYPMPGYKRYLQEKTNFKLVNKILIEGMKDKKEKFLIYRLNPKTYDLDES